MSNQQGRIVVATYRVAKERQPEFLDLLKGCESTMHKEGLITERKFVRMRSIEDPEIIIEVFEWVDSGAFERAQKNERVLAWWGRYESLWKDGGFEMTAVPEAGVRWAQYAAFE